MVKLEFSFVMRNLRSVHRREVSVRYSGDPRLVDDVVGLWNVICLSYVSESDRIVHCCYDAVINLLY